MIKLKTFYILIIALSTTEFFGQSFISDWTSFKNKDWTISFNQISSTSFAGKQTLGQLIFKNKKDRSQELFFEVYSRSDHDTVLKKAIHDWYFVQSCATTTKDGKYFSDFEYKDFYYYLKPCHNCSTAWSKECYDLAGQLQKIISKK